MAMTSLQVSGVGDVGARKRSIRRHVETGVANTTLTSLVAIKKGVKVIAVLVAYSATPTQAGVTTTLNSGAGAAYDNVLNTGTANARYNQYLPNTPPICANDDTLTIVAPAGGVGITASIAVYTEDLEYYGTI